MASYTVTGHPLNCSSVGLSPTDTDTLRAVLSTTGVGQTINLVLAGPDDAKVKGHGALK